ncbi:MAG: hypothetical protein J1F01_03065, partial [Oscillospiraceae bacterium]|nr:hypothetical protein [Oscillospiraceae bacterium]
MKSKKLISLLCAAAMTTSVFAGMVTTASAADDVYTFTDGSTTGWTIDNGGSVSTSDTTGDDTDPYLVIKGGGAGTRAASFTLPKATGSQYVVEFDSLIHGSDGMNNDSHYTQLAFGPAAMANPVESGYAVMMNAFRTNRTGIYVNGGEEAYDVQDKWTRTRIEVDGTSAKITMIDKSGTIIDEDEYTISASNVAKISARVARGDGPTPGDGADPGYVFLDNVHIYNGTAEGALTADGLRGEAAVATPYPEPETKVAAPALVVPEGITPVVDQNFSASFNQAMGAEEATYTDLTGLSIHFGGRSDNGADGDPATYAATSEYAKGDKTLELTGGRYSNQGRGPRVWATEKLSPSGDNSAVMAFAANLTSLVAGGAGRLYILGTDLQAGDTKDGAYNQVMAVLATDDYEYSEGEGDSLVIKVDPYTWYKVGVVVSGDKYRVYVAEAGEAWPTSAQIQRDHVGQGASSIGAVDLTTPYLAVTSADSKGGTTNPNVRIDNLLAYTGSAEEPRYLLPSEGEVVEPTPGAVEMHKVSIADSADGTKVTIKDIDGAEEDAYDGVFIHAKYADGRLTSVKSYPAKGITAAGIDVTVAADDAIALGDTLMVWSGLDTMVPYGKDTAKNSSVKEYAVKIGSLTGGSVVAKPANAEEGATVELTVTANDGYEYVDGSLKVMNGTTE